MVIVAYTDTYYKFRSAADRLVYDIDSYNKFAQWNYIRAILVVGFLYWSIHYSMIQFGDL